MGKIANGAGRQDRSNLEPSELHGKIVGRDTTIWDTIHNEGGIESTHQRSRLKRGTKCILPRMTYRD